MKRNSLLLIMVLASAIGLAQTPPAAAPPPVAPGKQLAEVLGFMAGNWEGEGLSRGEHQFLGILSVTSELEGNALLLRRESMNKAGGPSGGLQELMVIGFEGSTKKIIATLYDNKNSIGLYVGESKENELVLSRTAIAEGYVDRRIFKLTPEGMLSFTGETGSPGKAVTKMVEINFKKKM